MSDLVHRFRLTRRSFLRSTLRAGGVLLASASLASACAPAATSPTSAPNPTEPAKPAATTAPTGAAQPTAPAKADQPTPAGKPTAIKRGGTLIHSWEFTYPTFDWHLANIGNAPGFLMLYDTLLRYELVDPQAGTFEIRPGLAESWERVSDTAFVFKLRQGVKFHDGSDFDAEVARWNLLRMRDHEKSFVKSVAAIIDAVEVVDRHTVRVNLKQPHAGFLFQLTGATGTPLGGMLSKKAMESMGEEEFGRRPVGTGPMRFKQWITDDRVVLERNPDYWENGEDGKPLPYLDGFVSRYIPDPTVALVDLQSGAQHVLDNVPAKDVAAVKANPELVYWEISWAGPGYFLGGFNVHQGQFTDIRLRKACLHAIDRDAMVKALTFGIGKPWYYPWWFPGMLGYDESIPKYEYNPAKVKQYLQEAGKPNGIETSMLIISREPERTIGEMVAQMWTANGIRTKLEALERLTWIDRMRSKNFEFGFWRQSQPMPESSFNDNFLKSKAPGNWSQFEDPKVDQLLDAARATYDERRRHELYKEVLTYIQEQAYLTTGYMTPTTKAYRKNVKGLTVQYFFTDARKAWIDQ